jgi:DNA-binding MltR family transcriptional regulator
MPMGKHKNRKKRKRADEKSLWERVKEKLSFLKETERGAALIAAEILSSELEWLLLAIFKVHKLSEEDQKRLLTNSLAPLYSFAMRIAFCRAFGLISEEHYELLEAIREIRNHCGHSPSIVSLNDKEIADEVRLLQEVVKKQNRYKRMPAPRKALTEIVWLISTKIHIVRQLVIKSGLTSIDISNQTGFK